MNQFVDMHCHSTASDGTLPPEEVVRLAKSSGLTALALTDHDTIGGIAAAKAQAIKLGLDFLTGIEISATYPDPGTLHILGYGVDENSRVLKGLTTGLIEARDNRNPQIIQKLQQLGVAINMAEVEAKANGGVVGRPHIAAILVAKGYVNSIKQAFDKYLAPGGLAYFDKERLAPERALELIRQSGGIAVLAHAIQLRTANDGQLDTVIKSLVDQGLGGIEVIHSDHDKSWIEKCTGIAKKYNLLMTGGSDFHGSNKKDIQLGTANGNRVPREWFDELCRRIEANKSRVN